MPVKLGAQSREHRRQCDVSKKMNRMLKYYAINNFISIDNNLILHTLYLSSNQILVEPPLTSQFADLLRQL